MRNGFLDQRHARRPAARSIQIARDAGAVDAAPHYQDVPRFGAQPVDVFLALIAHLKKGVA